MTDSIIQLRRLPEQQESPCDDCNYSFRPASQDLEDFFKRLKTGEKLRTYLLDVQLVTEVEQLVAHREEILKRAGGRAQRFSIDDLRKVLDSARLWTRSPSRRSESGYFEEAVQDKTDKKRWRSSLKAINADKHMVEFLKKQGVTSRRELVEKADSLMSSFEEKTRRFSMRELKQVIDEFRQQPLPAVTDAGASVIRDDQRVTGQPPEYRPRQTMGSSSEESMTDHSEAEIPSRPKPKHYASQGNLLDSGVSQSGGLLNVIGHDNNLNLNLGGQAQRQRFGLGSQWPFRG